MMAVWLFINLQSMYNQQETARLQQTLDVASGSEVVYFAGLV